MTLPILWCCGLTKKSLTFANHFSDGLIPEAMIRAAICRKTPDYGNVRAAKGESNRRSASAMHKLREREPSVVVTDQRLRFSERIKKTLGVSHTVKTSVFAV